MFALPFRQRLPMLAAFPLICFSWSDSAMSESLTIIVLTHNEVDNLPRCLESVSGFSEIIVVDSGSGAGFDEAIRFRNGSFGLSDTAALISSTAAMVRKKGEWTGNSVMSANRTCTTR